MKLLAHACYCCDGTRAAGGREDWRAPEALARSREVGFEHLAKCYASFTRRVKQHP